MAPAATTPPPAETEAVAPAPPPVVVVQQFNEMQSFVNERSGVDLSTMPDSFRSTNNYAMPVVDETWRDKTLENGRVIKHQLTIADVNEDRFGYAYLDKADLGKPSFRGYEVVTKESAAAYTPEGKRIPERHFGGNNYIAVGEAMLCFCKKSYAKGMKDDSQMRCAKSLARFMPENGAQHFDGEDGRQGSVVSSGLEAGFDYTKYEEKNTKSAKRG